jgi:hypothetical protein
MHFLYPKNKSGIFRLFRKYFRIHTYSLSEAFFRINNKKSCYFTKAKINTTILQAINLKKITFF